MTDVVEAQGVESEVVREDLEPVGHVVMLEYDDVPAHVVREDLERLLEPTVLVRSSTRSWHVYGLQVRSWPRVVRTLRQSNASSEYVDEMVRRGTATLRTSPKIDGQGELRKPRPVPVGVTLTRPESTIEVSKPHCARLRQLAEESGLEAVADQLRGIEYGGIRGIRPVGRKLPQTRYETREEAI